MAATDPMIPLYDRTPVGVCAVRRDRLRMGILYANEPGQLLASAWNGPECADLLKKLKGAAPPADYTMNVGGHWIKLSVEPGEFGGEQAFILWITDISADKEAEDRLRRAVEEADAAAGMKANFLATMSHEIRTPMQSVYGLLELIGEEKPDEKIRVMAEIAKNSASSLLEILDDILDFAKMDSNKMELDAFEVPVRTLVGGVLEALAVRVHGKNVKLLSEIGQDVPFVIIGDPQRLRQILINLAGNAIKFTPEGSIVVRVTTNVRAVSPPANGAALRFEVTDTGIGMGPETCARLFQPFTQADNSTSRKFGGTGLGLSICRRLTEMMGGKIGVDSVEGKGSTFWFEIPTEEVGTAASTVELPTLDGISVLSVEDHPQGAKEIVRSLESMGATVESCPTRAEALALVRRRPFDVGVIDQGLPDGLGLDLIREIMEIRSFMGLIMYTVRDDAGLQHSLNALGVTYLAKPASRRGLGEAVKDASSKIARMSIDGPTRLLIAEDTESVRDVLRRQLDKLGVEADFVVSGAEAWEALETGRYGILFTDLHMPEIDGFELTARIRGREKDRTDVHFPVIVLTADVQMSQRQTYLGHGFDECLLKPVSLGQLRRLLIRWGLLEEEEHSPPPAAVPATPPSSANDQPPVLDLEKVKEQMGALDDSTIQMLHMFVDMTEPLVVQIRRAMDHEDYRGLREAAHSLKGAARSACCNILGDAASRLQDNAENRKPGCREIVTEVEHEFERAREVIGKLKTGT